MRALRTLGHNDENSIPLTWKMLSRYLRVFCHSRINATVCTGRPSTRTIHHLYTSTRELNVASFNSTPRTSLHPTGRDEPILLCGTDKMYEATPRTTLQYHSYQVLQDGVSATDLSTSTVFLSGWTIPFSIRTRHIALIFRNGLC